MPSDLLTCRFKNLLGDPFSRCLEYREPFNGHPYTTVTQGPRFAPFRSCLEAGARLNFDIDMAIPSFDRSASGWKGKTALRFKRHLGRTASAGSVVTAKRTKRASVPPLLPLESIFESLVYETYLALKRDLRKRA